jgi:hypothetical protein
MTDRLNLDVPYTNRLRKNLLQYEKNYNLNSEDKYYDDSYLYLPSNFRGGAINVHPDVHAVMKDLVHKYDLHTVLHGSGVWRSIKKGAVNLAKEAYNKEALLGTIKHLILDNEYIMTALKIGAAGAVATLLVTIGAPATVVALSPVIIGWTEIAIRDYLKRKKEIESRDREKQQSLPAPTQQQALPAPTEQPPPSHGYGMYNIYRHNLYDIGKEWHEYKSKKGRGMKQPRKSYNATDLDLRYQLGDVPVVKNYNYGKIEDNNDLYQYLGSGSYQKPKRKQSDRQKRRAELVKKIMREKGYNLAQASKYIKVNNLQY